MCIRDRNDPEQAHFTYDSWHLTGYERKLADKGLCYYQPMLYRNLRWYYDNFLHINVAFKMCIRDSFTLSGSDYTVETLRRPS